MLDDLANDIKDDPEVLRDRIDELLYPGALEDVDQLNEAVRRGFDKMVRGETSNESLECARAVKALQKIRDRDQRIRREEREAEARANKLEREKRAERIAQMEASMSPDQRKQYYTTINKKYDE
jgi:hypothetical protein